MGDGLRPRLGAGANVKSGRARSLLGLIGLAKTASESVAPPGPLASERLDVRAAVLALPAALDGSILPNGVVELLIEDFETPTRRLFDVNNGQIVPIEPGAAVPWASISGHAKDWAMALGAQRDMDGLRLTGDEPLARRVLDAIALSAHTSGTRCFGKPPTTRSETS